MKCPKCSRIISEDKTICLYCGTSLNEQVEPSNTFTESNDNETFIFNEETEDSDSPDLSGNIENISQENPKKVRTYEETMFVENSSDDDEWIENRAEMTLERALNLLIGVKDSFKSSHINSTDYKKLVLEIVKDYISTMGDKEKINFVANEIVDSELYEYLNEEIHKDLRSFVIDYVANK